jgi:hypothetical protein
MLSNAKTYTHQPTMNKPTARSQYLAPLFRGGMAHRMNREVGSVTPNIKQDVHTQCSKRSKGSGAIKGEPSIPGIMPSRLCQPCTGAADIDAGHYGIVYDATTTMATTEQTCKSQTWHLKVCYLRGSCLHPPRTRHHVFVTSCAKG